MKQFLPLTSQEMLERGWNEVDFVCVTGDSYVDHPSFGMAVISRLLENLGFRVGIVAQPQTDQDYLVFGVPRLGFMINSGNIDSMVSHYTVAKRKRSDDAYTAGNKAGRRPDWALSVYTKAVRRLCPDSPIIIGGIEASFRRFAHYDYWSDTVRPSVLWETGADLLSYGMGELSITEIATRLQQGESIKTMTDILGTCFIGEESQIPHETVVCPSYKKVGENKTSFAKAYQMQLEEQDYVKGTTVIQKHDYTQYVIQNPPARPLTTQELDQVAALPFMRMYHPYYEQFGGVKAIEEVEFSIIHNRGCFGGCNFCSITFHQGRTVSSRSKESVLQEAREMTKNPRFKGYVNDVGGPTANFRKPSCTHQLTHGVCKHRKCMAPTPCKKLEVDHQEYLSILRDMREIPKIKKVFVRSGLRFDYINLDRNKEFLQELVEYHVSGQLKVAPEHCSNIVLDYMGKPHIEAFDQFQKDFYKATKRVGKEQYLVPYLMSSHPGSGLKEAIEIAVYLKKHNLRPQQVQDFYPTPGTASTVMYYTGLDPQTLQPVYVAKDPEEKAMQRALLQYFEPRNYKLVRKALRLAKREDLIGSEAHCLVPSEQKSHWEKNVETKKESHPSTQKKKHTPLYAHKKRKKKNNRAHRSGG